MAKETTKHSDISGVKVRLCSPSSGLRLGQSGATPSEWQGLQKIFDQFNEEQCRALIYIAVWYVLGFVLTNVGYGMAPASYVEVVKSTEPVTSLVVLMVLSSERINLAEVPLQISTHIIERVFDKQSYAVRQNASQIFRESPYARTLHMNAWHKVLPC